MSINDQDTENKMDQQNGTSSTPEYRNIEEETDPMLAPLRELDDQKTDEGDQGKDTDPATQTDDTQNQGDAGKGDGDDKPVMIPKARLDEALRKSDEKANLAAYLQGVIDVQNQLLKERGISASGDQSQTGQSNGNQAGGKQADDPVATIDAQIDAKNAEILALAEKYEEGELSLKDVEAKRIEIQKEIRKLDDQRIDARVKTVEASATKAVNAQVEAQRINDLAIEIQQNHPYVAELDNLPDGKRQAAWAYINAEAYSALAAKGINPEDGTLESRAALMREKAALTNTYGPTFTGKQIKTDGNQTSQGKTSGLSPTAMARMHKADVSNAQPPSLQGSGVSGTSNDLTPEKLATMTQDQLADLLVTNPGLAYRAAGLST